jgi:hypothetical protein
LAMSASRWKSSFSRGTMFGELDKGVLLMGCLLGAGDLAGIFCMSGTMGPTVDSTRRGDYDMQRQLGKFGDTTALGKTRG